ncbi:MAG: class I SAM-dependent methyltransferase [Geminicoccaceae bacterium]
MIPSSTFNASDGAAYEQMMGRWSQRLAEPFLDVAGPVADGHILDVGCGTGSLTLALARRSPNSRVQGLDYSPDYVAFARARTDDPRLAFQQGDACAMPFPDAAFDQVLSLLMLHFVPRAPDAIAEMRRVARPGATVAATVWDARSMVAHRIMLDTAAVIDPEGDARRAQSLVRPMTRPGELAAAWQAAGFRDVRDTTLTIRMEFADFDDFWSPYLGGQGPGAGYVTALDGAARDRLRDHVRRAYLDGEADGPRSYTAAAWAVRGIAPG